MSNSLQVCLYNTEVESSDELRRQITALNFVRLVGEIGNSEGLAALLADGTVNLVFFHLDPKPAHVVQLIEQVAERFPDVSLIAISHEIDPQAILAPMRVGCDQYICEPIDHADLATAVGRVASKRLMSRGKSRCVCVAGAGGGAGATSIACNLALEIAQITEKECALVDLDLQFGNIAVFFDCEPQYTLYDLAEAGGNVDRSVVQRVLTQLPGAVSLLARPANMDQAQAITPEVVHHAVELLTGMHENVIVDLPRRIDSLTFATLSQADPILIICQLLVPSIRNAKRFFDSLVQAGIPEERIEVVVNRGDSSGGRITTKDLEELIKKPAYAVVPNDYQFVARSLDLGKPIAGAPGSNQVRNAMRKLASRVLGQATGEDAGRDSGRGFLSRLLSK